jgi:hypothetical protein
VTINRERLYLMDRDRLKPIGVWTLGVAVAALLTWGVVWLIRADIADHRDHVVTKLVRVTGKDVRETTHYTTHHTHDSKGRVTGSYTTASTSRDYQIETTEGMFIDRSWSHDLYARLEVGKAYTLTISGTGAISRRRIGAVVCEGEPLAER